MDALADLRAQLEEAVSGDMPPEARALKLKAIRDDIEHLAGVADTYLADTDLAEQAQALQGAHAVTLARENADLREQLISRRLMTADALDDIGFLSHESLDEAAEEGRLQDVAEHAIQEAWGLGLLHGDLFNKRVHRGFHGHFGLGDHKPESAVPHVPAAAEHQPQGGLVHPGRLRAEVATSSDGAARRLTGVRGAVKGKTFKTFHTPKPDRIGTDRTEVVRAVPDKGTGEKVLKKVQLPQGAPKDITAAQLRHDRAARGDTPSALHDAGRKRLQKLTAEAHKRAQREKNPETKAKLEKAALDLERAQGNPALLEKHGKAALYAKRAKKLNKRVEKQARKTKGAKPGDHTPAPDTVNAADMRPADKGKPGEVRAADLTSAEVHFNDVGKVSQKTLLAYANEAASQPTTIERYRNTDGTYDPSRAALHARIIDGLLREPNTDGSISFTNPYLKSADGAPTVLFTGGGYAAGKGGVVKQLKARGEVPDGALILDPDKIKAELPEFQDALASDPEANLLVYQEAWDIAQAAQKMAQERHMNVVVDGIANTSADEMGARVKGFTDAGYVNPRAYYVSIPTDEAIRRAKARAENASTPADRRMIPETIMRSVHRDVSAMIPKLMEKAPELGLHMEVWDNNRGVDPQTGQNSLAHRVAQAGPEGSIIHDPGSYQSILDKAQEGLKGVDAPTPGHAEGAKVPTTKTPDVEKQLAEHLGSALKGTEGMDAPKRAQPHKNLDALYAAADKAQPEFEQILNKGGGIAEALGAETIHTANPADFEKAKKAVAADPSKAYVVVADKKDRAAATKKVNGKYGGDASRLGDVVRGTVLVPSAQDVPAVLDKLQKEAEANGWKVTRAENKMVDAPGAPGGPTESGYRDLQLTLSKPGEIDAELQVNSTDNWLGKEVSGGHKMYEQERDILRAAGAEGRDLTPEEQTKIAKLQTQAKALYAQHWQDSLNRHPGFANGTEAAAPAAA